MSFLHKAIGQLESWVWYKNKPAYRLILRKRIHAHWKDLPHSVRVHLKRRFLSQSSQMQPLGRNESTTHINRMSLGLTVTFKTNPLWNLEACLTDRTSEINLLVNTVERGRVFRLKRSWRVPLLPYRVRPLTEVGELDRKSRLTDFDRASMI